MKDSMELVPDDWQRMLALVADPDDLEYGAASAIARWTAAGKWVGQVIITDGKAGIDGLAPIDAGPIREHEQESLRAHHAYLTGLGRAFDPEEFLRQMTAGPGAAIGVRHAVAFGRVQPQGV